MPAAYLLCLVCEDDEGGEDDSRVLYDKQLMPKLIVVLEASDEFLHERVINLPEIIVIGTHNTEDELTRRLAEYRAKNTDDNSVLQYFDELELGVNRLGQILLSLTN